MTPERRTALLELYRLNRTEVQGFQSFLIQGVLLPSIGAMIALGFAIAKADVVEETIRALPAPLATLETALFGVHKSIHGWSLQIQRNENPPLCFQ